MSNWLSDQVSDEQKKIDELTSKGMGKPTVKEDPSFFQGLPRSLATGPLAGTIKAYEAVRKPISSLTDYVEWTVDDFRNGGLDGPVNYAVEKRFSTLRDQREKERNDIFLAEIAQLEDAENSGMGARIGFGIGDFAARGFWGGITGGVGGAVTVTGASGMNYSFENLKSQGVDNNTAFNVSLIDGAVEGMSAGLPLSYGLKGTRGLIKDGILSVGGATGVSLAGQYSSGQVLEANDYAKQAKKYEITGESVAIEVGLNALMFGAGRYAAHVSKSVDAELKDLSVDEIEARTTQIESGLVLNEMDAEKASSPVKATDQIQENNHLINLDTATKQMKEGQPVSVKQEVKGEPKKTTVMNAARVASYTNKPWAKTIAQEAEKRGIPPLDAVIMSHLETGGTFDPNIKPPVNPKTGKRPSSALGLYQTLDGTHGAMGGGSRSDGNNQIKVGLNYYEHNAKIFKGKFGRNPTGLEIYFMHFFGEGGGPVFLKSADNMLFVDAATRWHKDSKKRGTARQQAQAITSSHGFNGLTVGQVKAKYQKRWDDVAKKYGSDGSNIQTVHGMDGSSYDVMPEIRSIDDLIASNDSAFGVNPDYPADLQPRDRTRAANSEQIEVMANNLRPELLSDSPKISDGSPILGSDGVVESGNGRTMAIRRAYETGKADDYKAFVQQYAADRGWDISGIKNPVLVRNRLTDTDRVEFARLANVPDVAQYSPTERAKADADRLPDSSMLKINNDGSINIEGSTDFVRAFADQLPNSERADFKTRDGRLSQSGKQRIESALAQRAYNDSNLITRLYENLDDDSKTVLNSLLKAAPQLAQLGDLVKQGGRHQNSIASDLAQAAQKLSDIKANGGTVRDYLNQEVLFDDGLTLSAKEFLNVFDSNSRSAKAIGEHIQSKIDEVEAKGDPRQGSLFGQTIEEQQALEIIMNNPDQEVAVSRVRPDGEIEEITMTLRERLDELEAEAIAAKEEGIAAETAANCALQFG
ncbi:hypothetical protein [Acinetobacter rudis]|uniref:DdrB-like domain-containing protein n=1 Tax=Acinetobacter rudis CIP 110305 TaxID=421052 RepID=S3NHI3_9GAMM|nr:hypothetical protein [Acinetobacter rudis]EPF73784.1 hypothetical protein F945_01943 [Acinetobacter rudis CIP 110305]